MAARVVSNGVSKDNLNVGAPNQTLYCTNLNDKLKKPDLRRALYMLFSTYGPVLDIVAVKNSKMRGQAHIVFRDIQTSTQAMRALQGVDFFGKEMKIVYAKGTSHIIPKLRGTFEAPNIAPPQTETTELRKSIFNAPPSNIPSKSSTQPLSVPSPQAAVSPGPQGVKRTRDEESDEEEAPMEEDDESDAPMEASSDED
ncbi:putative rna binding domain-containing protein [Phaeomoniella chlamydospora]|uniref:Putative rna binding domain-containing protein n=1 Tax=Phaeomoniella chlamydospora TaxID=158046 RepID=A0A0G2H0Y4_PHACM|nr:putative rna binding domain-containing protein [Phaeomoniella chlamydospora]